MAGEQVVDLIERQSWLNPLESGLQKAVASVFSNGEAGRKAEDFLHGKWLGHPLHVVLTDIPLGSWTATAVLDCMEMMGYRDCRKGADVSLVTGLAGAGCAAVAGLTDWHRTRGGARRVGIVHGVLNLITTGLYTASLVARRQRRRSAGRAYAFAGFLLSTASAYLGGELVYRMQVGVNAEQSSAEPLATYEL